MYRTHIETKENGSVSLKDKTYEILKRRIINCVYPPGTLLKEREIIEELGVSRTPFRETISALMYEDLVQVIPYQGIFVSEITLRDIENLYAVRERLELYALELCMETVPESALVAGIDRLQNADAQAYTDEAMRLDENVHTLVLHYADNKLLKRMMDGLYDQMRRVRVLSTTQDQHVSCTDQEHLAILQAMLEHDADKALEVMRWHIQSSKARALAALLNKNDKLYFKF